MGSLRRQKGRTLTSGSYTLYWAQVGEPRKVDVVSKSSSEFWEQPLGSALGSIWAFSAFGALLSTCHLISTSNPPTTRKVTPIHLAATRRRLIGAAGMPRGPSKRAPNFEELTFVIDFPELPCLYYPLRLSPGVGG